MQDVIIIGHGPAGISAAIYLKRSNISVTVIGKDLGALDGYTSIIENYYGFSEPISGEKLINNGIQQVINMDVHHLWDDVISIQEISGGFQINTQKSSYQSKAIVLATGKVRTGLKLPGFTTFRGKGISMCAACDGYFYRKKRIGIVGNGAYMQHELAYLSRLTDQITVFTHGSSLSVSIDAPVVTEPIISFNGLQKLTHIQTNQNIYPLDGVFVAIGAPSSLEFASQLGLIVENGSVVVDENFQTNIPGLFAAGDIIGGKLQIAKAVGDGMNTADAVLKYLKR